MSLGMLLDLVMPSRKRKRGDAELLHVEREIMRQMIAAALLRAEQRLAEHQPRKRVEVYPYTGEVRVWASCEEEASHIVALAPEFGARKKVAR